MPLLLTTTTARSRLCHEVNRAALRFYLQTETTMEGWTHRTLPYEGASTWQVQGGDPRLAVMHELIKELTEQLQRETRVWVCSVLRPILQEELRALAYTLVRQGDQHCVLSLDESPARPPEQALDRIVHEALDRSAMAIMEYECRAWSAGILLARLLSMASVQAALGRGAPEEELWEVVGWAYRRELLATLQQRISAIEAIAQQECATVEGQVLAGLQGGRNVVQEARRENVLVR
jgi:hypothetical protein